MPEKDWETINDDWAQHDMASGAPARRTNFRTRWRSVTDTFAIWPTSLAKANWPHMRRFVRCMKDATHKCLRRLRACSHG